MEVKPIIRTILHLIVITLLQVCVCLQGDDGISNLVQTKPLPDSDAGACTRTTDSNEDIDLTSTSNCYQSKPTSALMLVKEEDQLVPFSDFKQKQVIHKFGEYQIKIKQNWSQGGVAAVVWEAAVVLCEYFLKNPGLVEHNYLLELGAGTGLTAILVAKLGGHVIATDQEKALTSLKRNIQRNKPEDAAEYSIDVQRLDWGHHLDLYKDENFDVIYGADVIYMEEMFPLLIQTLIQLSNCKTQILLANRLRYERDTKFINMAKQHFMIREIMYDESRKIHLYEGYKKC